MPACLSRSLGFAALCAAASDDSLKMDSDRYSQPITSSLRRTLSADMASEKWKSQSGLKKIASLENLNFQDDEDAEDNGGPGFGSGSGAFEEIWSSIRREQGKKEEEETEGPRSQTDIWSSILSQKAINEQDANNTGENLPPPYIHPLVKRSASSLSEKSLEVCTESLGSETGSDGFSPDPASDSDPEEYMEVIVEATTETKAPLKQQEKVMLAVGTSSCSVKTKASAACGGGGGSPARSFPPPLPSLVHRGDGSNVQMRSHRQNGRLVLEAVSVPSNNCFKAERQDGRLLLTFSGRHVSDSEIADVEMEESWSTEDDEQEEVCDEFEYDDDEEESDAEEEEEDDVACGDGGKISYVDGTHKYPGLTRSANAATWPRRLNKVVNTLEDDGDDCYLMSIATALGRGVNPYVYSWRSKPGPGPTVVAAQLRDEVALEGKRAGKMEEEEVIPVYLRGCNLQQPRRSVLLWEPRCIAT